MAHEDKVLYSAVFADREDDARLALKAGANPDGYTDRGYGNAQGFSCLIRASRFGRTPLVRMLLVRT